MTISISQIEMIREKLEEMPEVKNPDRKVTRMEAVKMMAAAIRDMQSRGYTLRRISEILADSGLQIAPTTLKTYLQKVKESAVKQSSRSTKKTNVSKIENRVESTGGPFEKSASTPSGNTPGTSGVKPVPKIGFKPKEDSDEI
jgi:hypothetical protein